MDKLKILVVDDEIRLRKLVKDFLHKKGYDVLEASDGEEALDLFFSDKSISLIICDIMMPKLNGYEVVKEIRHYSDIPIIMLTAKGEEDMIWVSMSIYRNPSAPGFWWQEWKQSCAEVMLWLLPRYYLSEVSPSIRMPMKSEWMKSR